MQADPDHVDKEFHLYCSLTDLHGWQYFNLRGKSRMYQCIWGLVIFSSIVASSVILTYAFLEYLEDSVQTTYHPNLGSSDELYFPTVTICNINQIRKSFVAEFNLSNYQILQIKRLLYTGTNTEMTEEELGTVAEVARRETVVLKGEYVVKLRRNISSWKILRKELKRDFASMDVRHEANIKRGSLSNIQRFTVQDLESETILWAAYKDNERNPDYTTLFYPFYPTDYGRCSLIHPMIAFNPAYETLTFEELRKEYIEKTSQGVLFGKENGLTVLADAETYDYAFSPQSGEGFKLGITPYRDIPNMALSDCNVSPGTETQITIIPTITTTTDRARQTLNPEKRKCYFQEEFVFTNFLEKGHRYSLSNCLQEAMELSAYEKCGCDYFNRKRKERQIQCIGKSLACFKNVRKRWGTFKYAIDSKGRKKECFPACIDQTHISTATSTAFPNFNTFILEQRDFCALYLKLVATCMHNYKSVYLSERYGKKFCNIILSHTSKFSRCSFWPQANGVDGEDKYDIYDTNDIDGELQQEMYMYAKDNLVKVNVFFNNPVIKKVVRDIRLSSVMFLANIGGILGLAMGASIITLFELIYHSGRMLTLCSWRFIPRFHKSVIPNYVTQ